MRYVVVRVRVREEGWVIYDLFLNLLQFQSLASIPSYSLEDSLTEEQSQVLSYIMSIL